MGNGTNIKGKGDVRGFATTALPIIGRGVIIEVTECDVIPSEEYPYNIIVVPECMIKTI
jgi:hypothetical protein